MTVPHTFADQSGNVPASQLDENFAAVDFNTGLTANTTFYIRTDGNDSNTGLANTAGAAWETLQGAIDNLRLGYDFRGYNVTVQFADGTYTHGGIISGKFSGQAAGDGFTLLGNAASPSNVVFDLGAETCLALDNCDLHIEGFTFQNSGGGYGWIVVNHCSVTHSDCRFGAIDEDCIIAGFHSKVSATGPTEFFGAANSALHCTGRANIYFDSQTVTFTGDPQFATYLVGINDASISLAASTIVGTCRGRMNVHIGGILNLSSLTGVFFGGVTPEIHQGGNIIYGPAQDIIYVRTDGIPYVPFVSGGDGYANTAARAFATIPEAIAWVQGRPYDEENSRFPVISIEDGEYTDALVLPQIENVDGVIIVGDETTPANVKVTVTSADAISANGVQTKWYVRGITIKTITGGNGIAAYSGATISTRKCAFDTCVGAQILASDSIIQATGNHSIIGGAAYHIRARLGGRVDATDTVTITGTPTFSVEFVRAEQLSLASTNVTWTGGITGTSYIVDGNSLIDRGGHALPGTGGSATNGGVII